jgi:predicted phosphodiesterase
MKEKSVILSGDWHIRVSEDALRIDAALPVSTPLILMGDLIDTGIDRGMQWNQDNVDKQVFYLQNILKRRKVVGYVLGNHEDRIVMKTGLNPYRAFLGEPKTVYEELSIAIEHGSKVVQNPLTQVQTLATLHPKQKIIALGHDHTLGVWRTMNQWLVRTGHMQPYPGYAKKAILMPKPMGYIKVSVKTGKPEVMII